MRAGLIRCRTMAEPSQSTALRALWPHTRAILILLHVAAIGLSAIPAPEGGMQRKAWKDPTVQGELAAWGGRLRGVGLSMSDAQLEDALWAFAVRYMQVRGKLLAPARPYYRRLGTAQSWRMFVAPHKHPSRLEIAMDRGQGWEVVYLQSSPGEGWLEDALEHDRTRSVLFRYAWKSYRRPYRHMVKWLADRAEQDFPDATQMRVRWRKQRTPTPQQVRAGDPPPINDHSERIVNLNGHTDAEDGQ